MKLRGERRGGNSKVRAGEALLGEQPERPLVEWLDPLEHQPAIDKLQGMITVKKDDVVMKEYSKIAAFLKIICRLHPELLTINQGVLNRLALATEELEKFSTSDHLVGYFAPSTRPTLEATNIQKLQRVMDSFIAGPTSVDLSLFFTRAAFAIRIGSPGLVKWVAVKKHLDKLMDSAKAEKDYVGAAMLVSMYPEKRGQIMQGFTEEDWKGLCQTVKRNESKLLSEESLRPADAADLVRLMFAQQVFSASDARITPQGEVILTPPLERKLPPTPALPAREIL